MKKVFGLMMVLALAGLVSCGEAVVDTPTDTTTVNVEAPTVDVEAPVAEVVAPAAEDTMEKMEGMDKMDKMMEETPVVDETLTPSAE